jgi:type I restriction enzyme S subunit
MAREPNNTALSTPKTKISEYWNGDIPWLSVVDFNTGNKFVFDTEKKITY